MKEVNIYLYTQQKGPRRADRKGIYVLEWITSKGPGTLTGYSELKDCTQNKAEILNLINALQRLKMPVCGSIYACSAYLAAVMGKINKNQELCTNKKGEPISNAEEWQQVAELMKAHKFTVHTGTHAYLEWMKVQIKHEN